MFSSILQWIYVALLRTIVLLHGENRESIERGQKLLDKTKELDPQRRNLYDELWDRVRLTAILQDKSTDSASPLDKILNGEKRLSLMSAGLKRYFID